MSLFTYLKILHLSDHASSFVSLEKKLRLETFMSLYECRVHIVHVDSK